MNYYERLKIEQPEVFTQLDWIFNLGKSLGNEPFSEENEIYLKNEISKLIITKGYQIIGAGRNRIVLKMNGDFVIKFPINCDGIADNDWEGSLCSNKNYGNPDDVQYPNTRWFDYDGYICCIMEHVIMIENFKYENYPDWVGFVDCAQVGYTKKGRLVAFDYGVR